MIELEVRCCCNPVKLLGTISVDESYIRLGLGINFMTLDRTLVQLTPAVFHPVDDKPYMALKSNDYPIELLERLPNFKSERLALEGACDKIRS